MIELDRLAEARPPAFSDEALALRFSERHGGELRYVAASGRWLLWDGSRWQFDDTLRAFHRFRDRLEARGVFHLREPGTGRTGYQGLRLQIEPEGSTWWK